MADKPKVLIVEDDPSQRATFKLLLEDECDLIFAATVQSGIDAFLKNPGVSVVVIDGYLERMDFPDGLLVMRAIRDAGYDGPIVAVSSIKELREEMVGPGCCTHQSAKSDLPEILEEILNIIF